MSSDGRRANIPINTLTHYVTAARDTAPDGCDDPKKIASVAWAAYEQGRDPAEIWQEVVADGE